QTCALPILTKDIETATAFIENEFANIGLQPLKDFQGFRQEFKKERISPESVQVVVNGEPVSPKDVIIVSDNARIEHSNDLSIITLAYDSITSTARHFYQKAYPFLKDSASAIMLVAPEFRETFVEFKGYFEEHFAHNSTSNKIYILGKEPINTYSIN